MHHPIDTKCQNEISLIHLYTIFTNLPAQMCFKPIFKSLGKAKYKLEFNKREILIEIDIES